MQGREIAHCLCRTEGNVKRAERFASDRVIGAKQRCGATGVNHSYSDTGRVAFQPFDRQGVLQICRRVSNRARGAGARNKLIAILVLRPETPNELKVVRQTEPDLRIGPHGAFRTWGSKGRPREGAGAVDNC